MGLVFLVSSHSDGKGLLSAVTEALSKGPDPVFTYIQFI